MLTADTYGQGEADSLLGRALTGVPREEYCLVGAVGHDFYEGERDGPRGFPRFTDPRLRGEAEYASYLRMATERSLERLGVDSFDLLLLHNPDRIGYSSESVWDGMAALREAGLAARIGVAPGPANGFTLDLIACLERFGERIDWAMIILNPFEPWPGELCLEAAEREDVKVVTRVVDYGGLFWGDLRPGMELGPRRPSGVPSRRLDRGRPGEAGAGAALRRAVRPDADPARLSVEPCPPGGRVRGADPDPGDRPRGPHDRAAAPSWRSCPTEQRLSDEDVAAIRAIGDNTGCMALKGANPQHEGEERPDRWELTSELAEVGSRWGIDPGRDLVAS